MGLDMYAYVAARPGQRDEYYDQGAWDEDSKDFVSPVTKPREIAYWRKHPNLHGWMEKLWLKKLSVPADNRDQFIEDKFPPGQFNGVELELTHEDLDDLERAVTHGQLPSTQGFFFGNNADEYYQKHDLEFIKNARAELFLGLKVFYNSSW